MGSSTRGAGVSAQAGGAQCCWQGAAVRPGAAPPRVVGVHTQSLAPRGGSGPAAAARAPGLCRCAPWCTGGCCCARRRRAEPVTCRPYHDAKGQLPTATLRWGPASGHRLPIMLTVSPEGQGAAAAAGGRSGRRLRAGRSCEYHNPDCACVEVQRVCGMVPGSPRNTLICTTRAW